MTDQSNEAESGGEELEEEGLEDEELEEELQEGEEEEGYFHFHMRATIDLCFAVNLGKVRSNDLDFDYLNDMPEATELAYQQLWRKILADPKTRRRLLATSLLERAIDLYYNTDDILTDLAEEEDLVNLEGKRDELSDIAAEHLAPGAPYYFFSNKEATETTFKAEEGVGGLDIEPLFACIIDAVASINFEEILAED